MRDETGNVAVVESQVLQTLEIHKRRVREGKELMGALDFCRFILRSGLLPLFKEFDRDAVALRKQVEELMSEVQERFVDRDEGAQLKDEDFRTLHDKLDLIAGYVSRIPASPVAQPVPVFRIIEGGASPADLASQQKEGLCG